MKTIIKNALVNAVLTDLYIILISSFLFYAPEIFNSEGKADTVLAPIFMLSLLVFSASLTGILVFGKPIFWYLDGKKKEAVYLLGYTLLFFFIIIMIYLSILYLTA